MRRRLLFADRADAGRRLAERLAQMALPDPLVIALPRGGVPVGAEIARQLEAPLDVAFVRKIGAPFEPELAIGAIADDGPPVLNEKLVRALELSQDYIDSEAERERVVIEQRRQGYDAVRDPIDPVGRTVIVVDDGVATGMTMQAALRQLRRQRPARLVAAVPVASREAAAMLRKEADSVICLSSPRHFGSVGSFYRAFGQVSDAHVAALLKEAADARWPQP